MTSGPPASSLGPFSSVWESQLCCRRCLDAGETGVLSLDAEAPVRKALNNTIYLGLLGRTDGLELGVGQGILLVSLDSI